MSLTASRWIDASAAASMAQSQPSSTFARFVVGASPSQVATDSYRGSSCGVASIGRASSMHRSSQRRMTLRCMAPCSPPSADPLRVDYRLLLDSSWRSRSLQAVQEFKGERRSLALAADAGGRWWLNGRDAPELSDCVDIDLSLSPITNALPLNRLDVARAGAA